MGRTTEKVNKTIESKFRNQDLERQVVAFAIRKVPSIVSVVDPKWFSCKPLGHIISTSKRVRVTMTKDVLVHKLKFDGIIKREDDEKIYDFYISEIFKDNISQINNKNIQILIEQLYELYEGRRFLEGVKDIVLNLKSFELNKARSKIREISKISELVDPLKAGEYLEDFELRAKTIKVRVEKTSNEEDIGIPTGIARFDWLLRGLIPGEFGVVGGAPGVGKTATLICFAIRAWLSGSNVLFASGEMPKEAIQFRIDSNLSEISSQKFRVGSFDEGDFKKWENKITALRRAQSSFLEVVAFPRNFTAETLELEMLRVQEKHSDPIHLLCVDYLNIMDPVKAFSNSSKDWKSQADAVWDLKALTSDFNGGISTWTAGQIRDEYVNASKLGLDSLKYARAISETAPIVVGLVRTEDDILYNTLQFQVLKLRNAPLPRKPVIMLYPNLDIMKIHREVIENKSLLTLEDDTIEGRRSDKKR